MRPGFLTRQIRNGSGNGGGVLIGYMPVVCADICIVDSVVIMWSQVGNLSQTVEIEDDGTDSVKFAKFKREVYHKVLCIIFSTLKDPSQIGDTIHCGDSIMRVIYPGIIIQALDGEEACYSCGTRGARALHPCPRCLVSKGNLHVLSSRSFPK